MASTWSALAKFIVRKVLFCKILFCYPERRLPESRDPGYEQRRAAWPATDAAALAGCQRRPAVRSPGHARLELRAACRFFGITAPDKRIVRLARAAAWQQCDRPFGREALPRDAGLRRRYAHRSQQATAGLRFRFSCLCRGQAIDRSRCHFRDLPERPKHQAQRWGCGCPCYRNGPGSSNAPRRNPLLYSRIVAQAAYLLLFQLLAALVRVAANSAGDVRARRL